MVVCLMKLYPGRTNEFFNASNAPLPETGVTCWEFPLSPRPLEYSSMNFIEWNGSQPSDAGLCLTSIFDKYFKRMYWLFPVHGFSPSTHFMYTRNQIGSLLKVFKSLYIVEEIGSQQTVLIEGKYVDTRQVLVKGLTAKNNEFFLDHFSALLDADLADEIMVKSTAASTFINGIVAEIRQSGGRRNSILTLKADYALSTYDIVQSLIGIVASRRYRNSAERSDIGEINDIREGVGNIYGDIEHHLVVPLGKWGIIWSSVTYVSKV
jgi:hypothetical protein